MEQDSFLGRGMKFPPQVNPVTGRFMCAAGKESVKESIYLILMTHKTERSMRPEFGSNVMSYVFAQTNETMMNLMAHEIERDISNSEPRVENVTVTMDTESRQGCLFLYVDYTVRGENVSENMVFPFYLGEQPGEESKAYETMEYDRIE